jgi:hypothetical protein
MFIRNEKRFNIYSSQEIDGVTYPSFTDPALREQLGITEIADPVQPEDYFEDVYDRNEYEEAPFVIYTKKSDEQIAQMMQAKLNAQSLAYLASTDWMAIRASEGGKAMTEEVKTKRQEARNSIVLPAEQETPAAK